MTLKYLNWQAAADPVTSGADGRFVFIGLKAGSYILGALLNGEEVSYRESDSGNTVTVKVGAGSGDDEAIFRAALHPSVSGTVLDEAGEPVPGAYIAAFHAEWRDGRVVFEQQMPGQTDDRGRFRLPALHPGSYYICASWLDFGANPRLPAFPAVVDFTSPPERLLYRRSCYPEEPPTSFRLDWGQEREIQLALEPVLPIPIQGHVTNAIRQGTEITLQRQDRTATELGGAENDGTFKVEAAIAGRYLLWAKSVNHGDRSVNRLVGRESIVVEASGLRGIEVDMQPAGSIDVFTHSMENLPVKQYSVFLGLTDTASALPNPYQSENGRDGSIRFPSVDPATYWLSTYTEEPFCVESIRLAGREVLHGIVPVAPGSALRLDVNLTTHCGAIEGHVLTGNKPAAFAEVWLLASGSAKSPGEMAHTTSGDDGDYSFNRLPPGRYWLWAWAPDDWVFGGPASLAQLENMASPVTVTSDHVSRADLIQIVGDRERK
jgi:hypothetical protein